MNTATTSNLGSNQATLVINDFLLLAARVLLAVMFVSAGWSKIGGFEGTVGYINSVGLPFAELAAVGTIALEIMAGLAIIAGFQIRWAALALAGFTLLAAILFHNYWAMPAEQAYMQQLMFMKNLSIAGGLLALSVVGAGKYSMQKSLS